MAEPALDNVRAIRPDLQVVEQRVADTDDGYTRLANELLEELIGANLTRNQAKVAFAVCRKTYGFNKKTDRIADSQLSQLTKLPRQKVNKAKNELIDMKVLIKDGLAIGPNKNLSEWSIPDCHRDSVTATKRMTKSVTKTVTALSPKQGHTKDTITKDNKQTNNPLNPPRGKVQKFDPLSIPIPDWLNRQAWTDWINNRAETKKPFKTERGITAAFKLLKECLDEGHDPVDVINASIANGYQGLFKPKFPIRKQTQVQQQTPHWNSPEGWKDFL